MIDLNVVPETAGRKIDLSILEEEEWLKTAAVIPFLLTIKGRHWIYMVYADTDRPFCLRVRQINHYSSRVKAEQNARYFQRGMQRDPRGTSKLNLDDFDLCAN